jgi:hypothetical protein
LPYLVANVVEILEPDAEDGTIQSDIHNVLFHKMWCYRSSVCIPFSPNALSFTSFFRSRRRRYGNGRCCRCRRQ